MSVRTIEELADRFANDLIWRKRELTVLATLVANAQSDREDVLIRALVTILYAHWEGFVKATADSYLEFLANRRLKYVDLKSNFVALGLQARIREAASRTNLTDLVQLIDGFRSGLVEQSRLPKQAISSEANLSSRVLFELTTCLGISYSPFATKKFAIDDRLLKNRNQIAHGGRNLPIAATDVLELRIEIVDLMDRFQDEILNAVAQTSYRAINPGL